ncbi:MAG: acylphosphatase [Halanaerobiaceae bacterium]
MVNVRKHVYIRGRVQGVGFRAFVRNQAKMNNINGWVKNLPDGRVEAILTGKRLGVNKIIDKIKEGPRMAEVRDVDIFDETFRGEFASFTIKY